MLLFCLKQCFLSGSFFPHDQSKHGHSHWHGPSSPPTWLQGHTLQGQVAPLGQQQPVHSRGLMPIWRITGYSMSHHRYVAFSSLFLPRNLALFFLPLSTHPNMKTLCSRSDKASTVYGAEGKQHRGRREPIMSQTFPTHLLGQ